jgi:hypothetical protein
MRSINQLQSIKFNKDGYGFINEIEDVRDVWGLFIYTYEPKEKIDISDFYMNVSIDLIGTVIHYNDGRFECNFKRTDFQAEYSEEELKEVIIKDITFEMILSGVYENNVYKNLSKNLSNINFYIKEGIDTISELDDSLTDLKKNTDK